MADSTCLMRGFSYPSAIPNESQQGNLMLALGDSVSFGRFLNESLSWEKRSTFLHRNYVEEAERYSRPGSVAQKKAFFEAHYKRIAAKKAADILEQETAGITEEGEVIANVKANDEQLDVHTAEMENVTILTGKGLESVEDKENVVIPEDEALENRPMGEGPDNLGKQETVSASESQKTMERSLPKPDSAASADIPSVTMANGSGSNLPSLEGSIQLKTWSDSSAPANQISRLEKQTNATQGTMKSNVDSMDVKGSPSKSLSSHMKTLVKQHDADPISSTMKTEKSGHAHSSAMAVASSKEPPSKSISALVKPPIKGPYQETVFATMETENSGNACSSTMPVAPSKGPPAAQSTRTSTNPAANPESESTSIKTPLDSSTLGSKSTRRKWHHFSAVFSKSLRDKTAAKSKQKLEENSNTAELQKVPQQKSLKDKGGNRLRKLTCIFCFKDSPLLDQTELLENQGTISIPPPSLTRLFKNSSENDGMKSAKFPTKSFTDRIAGENTPPNIQQ